MLLLLAIPVGGGVAAFVFFRSRGNEPAGPPPEAQPAPTTVNASDPPTPADLAQEQGCPFEVDLAGHWRLTLPAGFQPAAKVELVDKDHCRLRIVGVMNGVYRLVNDQLVMVDPVDKRKVGNSEFGWQIDDEKSLELIGRPDPARYGAN